MTPFIRPHNITSILNNFKTLIKKAYQKVCTDKFNKKNDQNIYFTSVLRKSKKKYII